MDNHWLMKSEVLTLLRRLRKRLQAEFDITLRFSDADLEAQLARARERTVDTETREIIATLESRRGEPFTSGDEVPPRFYRGQPILQEATRHEDIYTLIYGDELPQHDGSRRAKGEPLQVYRGQPVLREKPALAARGPRRYRGHSISGGRGQ
ncbi:hypothetical protein [Microbulbifer sp. SAOS-129_SWC]|uniref:hypothetical protein n=1 Tax=Microbulbifer sp. SAOS-129_SWC TaxID=3145235 RepID=UPI003216F2FF